MERKVLGKGLEALIPKRAPEKASDFVRILLENIQLSKFQPRLDVDSKELKELTESIKKNGIIQPIVVREIGLGKYELIAGARRYQACKSLGIKEIPALIKNLDDQQTFIVAILENLQRKNLNPYEEALAFQRLNQEFSLTQEEIASIIGKDKSYVANTLRLLKLPKDILEALKSGQISRSQARTLLSLDTENKQREIFLQMITQEMSVRQLEESVRRIESNKPKKYGRKKRSIDPFIKDVEEKLQALLGTKVRIQSRKDNKGTIIIEYYSIEDLERIIKKVR